MWRCNCCHREFEEPEYDGTRMCPVCDSDEIVESRYIDSVYSTPIYPGDVYYEVGADIIAEENIEVYLEDNCRFTARG